MLHILYLAAEVKLGELIHSTIVDFVSFLKANIIPLSSFFVAASSFCVSWMSYRRDSGRLDISLYLAEVRNGTTLMLEQNGLQINIVNSGRRPLIVTNIGGDIKWQQIYRLAQRILKHRTPSWLTATAFVVHDELVTSAIMKDGNFKTLLEGQSINIFLPFPKGKELMEYISKKCSGFYVFDSMGRKHRVSKGTLAKLSYDTKKFGSKK
jgi:hypothetical protein